MDSPRAYETTTELPTATASPKAAGLLKYCEKHPIATTLIDTYSTAIKTVTGVGFLGHFLRLRSSIDAQEAAVANNTAGTHKKLSPIRRAGAAGLAWSVVWLGVLSATTLAEESVHRRVDPVAIHRKHKVPWNVELPGKEEI